MIPLKAHLGAVLPLWSGVPFVGLLLSLALFPLCAPRFWQKNYHYVVGAWGLGLAIPFVFAYGGLARDELAHMLLLDYLPFIILLLALFTVTGGIYLEGALRGTPFTNVIFLFIGTVIASWIGTTGASMLLIRPVIRTNARRKNKVHLIVFFIFLISNIGGALTPLGDPPLFLGFLRGVPFFWTFSLLPATALLSGLCLAIFFMLDTIYYRREKHHLPHLQESHLSAGLRLRGGHNFIYLGGIVAAVLFSGLVQLGELRLFNTALPAQDLIRDILLLALCALSMLTTAKKIRLANQFCWHPIIEVAVIFAAIFVTILPVLAMLRTGAEGPLAFIPAAAQKPWHYFWITGTLSSFLDNAPTYLTFLTTALGNFFNGRPEHEAVLKLIAEHPVILQAISAGAVFMGANTYIGNAPNFMVRVIAEESGIQMPSFFGYMAWSALILLPLFVLVTLIFFV